jgi:DNA-binding NarL/FixJ family response regulator
VVNLLFLDDQKFSLLVFESRFNNDPNFKIKTVLLAKELWFHLDIQIPDILLLDIEMPVSGWEIAHSVNLIYPQLKIVFLTASLTEERILQSISLTQVYGCFDKATDFNLLKESLLSVHRGHKIFRQVSSTKRLETAPPQALPLKVQEPFTTNNIQNYLEFKHSSFVHLLLKLKPFNSKLFLCLIFTNALMTELVFMYILFFKKSYES